MIYIASFFTTEDVFFVIDADNSTANAVARFEDGDNKFGVDVSLDDGVDARPYNADSGVTASGTSGNFADFTFRGKQCLGSTAFAGNLPFAFLHFNEVLGMIDVVR